MDDHFKLTVVKNNFLRTGFLRLFTTSPITNSAVNEVLSARCNYGDILNSNVRRAVVLSKYNLFDVLRYEGREFGQLKNAIFQFADLFMFTESTNIIRQRLHVARDFFIYLEEIAGGLNMEVSLRIIDRCVGVIDVEFYNLSTSSE
jgi:hypothetical protein